MKTRFAATAAGLALVLSACIPSLNPFYATGDVAFDARLVGSWQDEDGAKWTFTPAGSDAYEVAIERKEGKPVEFEAHRFTMGGRVFLDLIPSSATFAGDASDVVEFAYFPGHVLALLGEEETKLQLAFFNWNWLEKQLARDPRALAHRKQGDRILLTARTTELREFVLSHLGHGELFGDPGVLVRAAP